MKNIEEELTEIEKLVKTIRFKLLVDDTIQTPKEVLENYLNRKGIYNKFWEACANGRGHEDVYDDLVNRLVYDDENGGSLLSRVFAGAFIWGETPDGIDFWHEFDEDFSSETESLCS